MDAAAPPHRLWVIVPAYQEERSIPATLTALAGQRDREFTLLIVDNGSTDGTAAAVGAFGDAHPELDVRLVREPEKGTGRAADTGMRHAIAEGAVLLARTDADCLPDPGWTAALRASLDSGLELVTGPLRPRTDEFRLRAWERWLLPAVVSAAAWFGRFRPGNQDPAYQGPYMMCPGCNLGITAALYQRSGGFPRTSIELEHEDRALVNRVRRISTSYGHNRRMRVHGSVRRLRAYGLIGTLGWYADHRNKPAQIDIR